MPQAVSHVDMTDRRHHGLSEFDNEAIPIVDAEPVPSCLICGSTEHKPYAEGFDYESRTCRNRWRFVQCDECKHAWLNPRPRAEALPVIYPPTYYAYNYERAINPIARRGKAWLDRLKLRSIRSFLATPAQSYLDVGCGDGRFLRAMEKLGVPRTTLYGIELDGETARSLAKAGYQVASGRVVGCDMIRDCSIDLATMFNVIEHVSDPAAVLRRLATWIRPAGVLAVETPNIDSSDAKIFRGSFWGGYHFPRHWHLFNPVTITRLLERSGFSVRAIRFHTGHSFWMYSFHHALRYNVVSSWPKVARLFDPLQNLPFLVGFTGLDVFRALIGFKTSAMVVVATRDH